MESSNTRSFVSCTLHSILNFSRGWSVLSLSCCLLLWKIPKTNTLKELRFTLPDCFSVSNPGSRAAFCLALSNKIVAEGCWFLGVGGGRFPVLGHCLFLHYLTRPTGDYNATNTHSFSCIIVKSFRKYIIQSYA